MGTCSGVPGAPGVPGVPGVPIHNGLGSKGDRGEKGSAGKTGPKGNLGQQGPPGEYCTLHSMSWQQCVWNRYNDENIGLIQVIIQKQSVRALN